MHEELLKEWSRQLSSRPYYWHHFIVQRSSLAVGLLVNLRKSWSQTVVVVPQIIQYVETTPLSSHELLDSLFILFEQLGQLPTRETMHGQDLMKANLQRLIVKLSAYFSISENNFNLGTASSSSLRNLDRQLPQFELNEQYQIIKVNAALLQKFSATKELLARQPFEVLFTETSRSLLRFARQQLEKGDRFLTQLEVEAQAIDGRQFRVTLQLIRKHSGGYTGFLQDVSEMEDTANMLSLLSLAIEKVGEGIVVYEPAGQHRVLYVNEALEKLTGKLRQKIIGHPVRHLFGENTPVFQDSQHPIYTDGGWKGEIALPTTGGRERIIQMHTQPVYDDKLNLLAIVGILRDVSEERHSQREILALHHFIEQIFYNLPYAILVTDEHLKIYYWNNVIEKLTGRTRKQVTGQELQREFPAILDHVPLQIFKNHQTGSVLFETRFHAALFGEYERTFQLRISGIQHENQPLFLWTLEDLTELELLEKRIRFLSEIPENSPILVEVLDNNGQAVYRNPLAQKLIKDLGMEEAAEKELMPPEFLEDIAARRLEGEEPRKYLHQVGNRYFQFFAFQPARIPYYYVYAFEVTERLEMQQRLLQTERVRVMGEMAAGVAHDFNNLLATILGRTQLLLVKQNDPEIQEELKVVEKAAREGSQIVKRLQQLTRARNEAAFQPVNLGEIIRDSLEFANKKAKPMEQLKGHRLIVETKVDDDIYVSGNPVELKEVFTNLFINAYDAMPEGGTLRIEAHRESHEWCRLYIADTGPGIPEHVLPRIFDPFFTTKGERGTGLGLSLAYNIINAHRGNIRVESRTGQGTTFIIDLPTVPKPEIDLKPEKEEKHDDLHNLRILIVDDEPELLNTLYDILNLQFSEVVTAENGKKAIEFCQQSQFDVVLTDLGMPEISGWQVAQKAKELNPAVKTILITGWGEQAEHELERHTYVDAIVSKPYDMRALFEVIQKLTAGNGVHN